MMLILLLSLPLYLSNTKIRIKKVRIGHVLIYLTYIPYLLKEDHRTKVK